MKILLVEDHAAVAEISCSLLREVHQHEVEHVARGAEVLGAMKRFHPDLVLLDLNLPDMSGYEIASRIRAEPQWEGVTLVALTGFGSVVNAARAAEVGIDAHFRKPMNFELLPTLKRTAAL